MNERWDPKWTSTSDTSNTIPPAATAVITGTVETKRPFSPTRANFRLRYPETGTEFFNDATDRDLQIDYLSMDGNYRQAENQEYNTGCWNSSEDKCGKSNFDWLHCNGIIGFGDTPNPGNHTTTTSGGSTTTSGRWWGRWLVVVIYSRPGWRQKLSSGESNTTIYNRDARKVRRASLYFYKTPINIEEKEAIIMKKRIWLYTVITVLIVVIVGIMLYRTKGLELKPTIEKEKPFAGQQRVKLPDPPVLGRTKDDLHVAWAQLKENGKLVISIDGKVDSTEYDEVSIIVFSPDGKRVAFPARNGSKWAMVVDCKAIPDFDDISLSCITFSPDSKHFAFGALKDNRWFVVLDGEVIPKEGHDFVGYFAFSPDNKHFVYAAGKSNNQSVIADGKTGKEYSVIGEPVFGPDSKHLAYVATDSNNMKCVVLDGKEGTKYNGVNKPIFSKDSKHVAYSVMKDKKRLVVIDGKEGPEYEMSSAIDYFLFGPNDNRLAYAVGKDEKWVVVVDGKEGLEYNGIGGKGASIVLSPDGKSFAYAANIGEKWFVVTNDKEGPVYDGIAVGTPVFSPDGKHLIYGAREDNKWFIVLDGNAGAEEYDAIGQGAQFSPDSKHFTFTASKDNKWFVVLDGKAGPPYDRLFKTSFTAEGVEYLAERDSDGYLLRCRQPYSEIGGETEVSEIKVTEEKIAKLPEPTRG